MEKLDDNFSTMIANRKKENQTIFEGGLQTNFQILDLKI